MQAIAPATAADVRSCIEGGGGNWCTPANRADGQRPDSPHEAAHLPDAVGGCGVTLDLSCTLDGVTLDAGGPWLCLGGHDLALPGPTFRDLGSVLVNDNQATLATSLLFDGDVTLPDGGDLWQQASGPCAHVGTTGRAMLTKAAGHAIHGLGPRRPPRQPGDRAGRRRERRPRPAWRVQGQPGPVPGQRVGLAGGRRRLALLGAGEGYQYASMPSRRAIHVATTGGFVPVEGDPFQVMS